MLAAPVAGVLLTGGSSRRMGFPKANLPVAGVPNATRLAALLHGVARPVVEVGPGYSGLPNVLEEPPGAGPLVALCAGADAVARLGHAGPVVVLACDLARLTLTGLRAITTWPGGQSVMPLVGGRPQPLCARWAAADLEVANVLVAKGQRSLQSLLDIARYKALRPDDWPEGMTEGEFSDVDTVEELVEQGLAGPEGNALS